MGHGWRRRAHRVQPEGSPSAGRRWKARAADNHIPASESESNRWVRSQEVVNRWNAQEVGVCGIAWACIRGVGRTRWQKERSAHDAPSSKIFLGHNPLGRKPPLPLWKLTLLGKVLGCPYSALRDAETRVGSNRLVFLKAHPPGLDSTVPVQDDRLLHTDELIVIANLIFNGGRNYIQLYDLN